MSSPSFLTELPEARRALSYAAGLHEGQARESDHAAFILHPLEVASLLHTAGHQEPVIVAAILHDVIENTYAAQRDIAGRFGAHIATLVAGLTENAMIEPWAARKAALREQVASAGPDVQAIYLADKLAKARELRIALTRDSRLVDEPLTAQRLEHYEQSLQLLERHLPEHPLTGALRFELEALNRLPPRPPAGEL